MRIAEWLSLSVNQINFKSRLCGLLPKKLSQEEICKTGGSVETLEKPQEIIKGIQSVHKDTGQIWDTLKSIDRNEVPCLI